jgi:hypothetical protein
MQHMTYEDLSDDLAQIARLRMQRRFPEARLVLRELRMAFDGHPDLHRGKTQAGLPALSVPRQQTMSIVVKSPLTRPRRPSLRSN